MSIYCRILLLLSISLGLIATCCAQSSGDHDNNTILNELEYDINVTPQINTNNGLFQNFRKNVRIFMRNFRLRAQSGLNYINMRPTIEGQIPDTVLQNDKETISNQVLAEQLLVLKETKPNMEVIKPTTEPLQLYGALNQKYQTNGSLQLK